MHISKRILRVVTTTVAVTAIVALIGNVVRAQEPLRWKFQVGQMLNYNMVQDMKISTGAGAAAQNLGIRQEMDMSWEVKNVKPDGEAVISQKFDRMKSKITTPLGGFEFDSKSEEPPTGPAAMMAPLFKTMSEAEFEFTMTPRGEVKDVKVPEELLTALQNTPGGAGLGDMATPEGFKKMIAQGALVLPENAPKVNEEWTNKVEMKSPVAGNQVVETTYRYDGDKEIDGAKFAVFRPILKMGFEGGQLQTKITEQESGGEILFHVSAGRLHSTNLKHNVTVEATTAGQTMQQKIDQTIDVKVTPLDKAAERSASAEKAAEKSE